MLIRFAHRLVAHPAVYDAVQTVVGARSVRRRFARATVLCRPGQTILDVGGGTGLLRALCPDDCRYICLDNEPPKLHGFLRRHPGGSALLADAVHIPIKSGSVDVVVMAAVAHHLSDGMLAATLQEARRILRPGGTFLFLDAVLAPTWIPGKMLWALDRGAHPRSPEQLIEFIETSLRITSLDRFGVVHKYLICVAHASPLGATLPVEPASTF